MTLNEYINLLHTLSGTALTIWGFLLTVSLGIVAFLGSLKSPKIGTSIMLCLLFVGFSYSNHKALQKNFDRRIAINETILEISASKNNDFKKAYEENKKIIKAFNISKGRKNEALWFQAIMAFLVTAFIVAWPFYRKG